MAETALKILAVVSDVLTSEDSEEVSPHVQEHELLHKRRRIHRIHSKHVTPDHC